MSVITYTTITLEFNKLDLDQMLQKAVVICYGQVNTLEIIFCQHKVVTRTMSTVLRQNGKRDNKYRRYNIIQHKTL